MSSTTSILLIAHAPLAHALRECALHVFPDCGDSVLALDVPPSERPEDSLARARALLAQAGENTTLVLTDVFGATPCNVAQRLVEGVRSRVVSGVNLPMLLRAVSYRSEPLDSVMTRAVVGGTQGVMQVAISAPQNQYRRNTTHDQDPRHHQQ
ncbi:PTS sugar transporter subunit IIA [Acidovorax sp.]|jgi:PTS system mannose-specific IIA component|uniref:PTS sugar transporter subunit IIA n=1 Tax=Acidovorax sp. TaxID=1872122 RepID=UPI00391F7E55